MQEYGAAGRGGPPRPPWPRWSVAAAVLALPGAGLVFLRMVPWDLGTPWIQLLSLFPAGLVTTSAALAAAVVAVCLQARTRRAVCAALVAALLVTQLGMVLERVLPPGTVAHVQSGNVQPANVQSAVPPTGSTQGTVLTVMAVNVGYTGINAAALVVEIKNRNVDVLALPELAPGGLKALDRAGLSSLLPARALDVEWVGTTGSALFSRFHLKQVERVPGSAFHQSRAVARVPAAAGPVHLTAVHVDSPRPGHIPSWRAELRQLGELWQALPGSRQAVLLGDFNASADHGEFRELLATGLADAAEVAGKGLAPTWPVNSPLPAFVAIDHVLVSPGIGVADFQVVTVPGTDHAAVVARLVLP